MANRPFIVCCLYLATFFTIITCIVGIVLLYIFRSEPHDEWEATHYQYLIRTFWIGAFGILTTIVGIVMVATEHASGLALFVFPLFISVQVIVRTVLSMVKALGNEPMPKPRTLLF